MCARYSYLKLKIKLSEKKKFQTFFLQFLSCVFFFLRIVYSDFSIGRFRSSGLVPLGEVTVLNLGLQGIKCPKEVALFLLLWTLLQNGSKDLLDFLHECRGQQGYCFRKIVFVKKKLIQGYRGLSVQKRCFFYFFELYPKTALRIFSMFCISVEDNRAHYLSKIVF